MPEMSTPTPTAPRQYAVFISYRHADNLEMGRKWANWLHEALESYEVPPDLVGRTSLRGDKVPASLYPVFRDEAELPADADLSTNIRRALENSGLLVVLCSPRAVQSRFVADEIRYFKEQGRSDRMLALMIDGEPNASDDPAKVELFGAGAECFPEPLRFGVAGEGDATRIDWSARTEPIAADVRPGGRCEQGWTTAAAYREQLVKEGKMTARQIGSAVHEYGERLELAKLKVISGALGLPLGELTQRDKAFQLAKAKRRQRVIATAAVVFGVLAVLAAGAGWIAWEMRGRADAKAHELSDTLGVYSFYEGTNRLTNHETTGEALAYLARGAREYGNQNCADRILTFIQQRPMWVLVPSDKKRAAVVEAAANPPASGITGPAMPDLRPGVLLTAQGPNGMTAAAWGDQDGDPGSPSYFRIWDAQGKALTPWIEPKFEAMNWQGQISDVVFSPDGLYVAVRVRRWREPEFLQVFHVSTGKQVGDTLVASGEGSNVQSASFTHVSFTRSRARGDEKNGALLAGSSRGDAYWMDLTVSSEGEATSYQEAVVSHHYAVWAAALVKDGEEKNGDYQLLVSASEDGKINLTRAGDSTRGLQAGTLNAGGKVEEVSVDTDGAVEVVVEGGRQLRLVKIPNLDLGLKMPEVPVYEVAESKPGESVIAAKSGAKVQFTIPDGPSEEQSPVYAQVRVQPVPLCVRVTHLDKSVACYGVDASYKHRLLAKGAGSLLTLTLRGGAPVDVGREIADITPGAGDAALAVGFADFSYRVFSPATGAAVSALMDEKLFFAQGGQPDAIKAMYLSPSGTRLLTQSQHWEPPNAMLNYLMVWDCATGVPMTDRVMSVDDGLDEQPNKGNLFIDDTSSTASGLLRYHAQAEEFEALATIAENLGGLRLTQSREFQAVEQSPEVVRELFGRLKGK